MLRNGFLTEIPLPELERPTLVVTAGVCAFCSKTAIARGGSSNPKDSTRMPADARGILMQGWCLGTTSMWEQCRDLP